MFEHNVDQDIPRKINLGIYLRISQMRKSERRETRKVLFRRNNCFIIFNEINEYSLTVKYFLLHDDERISSALRVT